MNATISKVKSRFSELADSVCSSKVYRTAEKIAVGASSALAGVGLALMNASALDIGSTVAAAASADKILENAEPFMEPAIVILCAVGGIKLGMRFLRGSLH